MAFPPPPLLIIFRKIRKRKCVQNVSVHMHAFLTGGFFPPHCSLAVEQKEGILILLSSRIEDGKTHPAFMFSAVWLTPPREHLL